MTLALVEDELPDGTVRVRSVRILTTPVFYIGRYRAGSLSDVLHTLWPSFRLLLRADPYPPIDWTGEVR